MESKTRFTAAFDAPAAYAAGRLVRVLFKGARFRGARQGVQGRTGGTGIHPLGSLGGFDLGAVSPLTPSPSRAKFKDPSGTPDGAQKALLTSGTAGTAKALVKGKGVNLSDTFAPMLPLPVTAQLVNDTNGACFETVYNSGDVIKNDPDQFKAKAQQ